ncbi:hypothetical protein FB567DRAFT_611130 [Paraphoma chrysanthemicola]|uniref:Peptidase A1 domain-containing protein n=1 Tax=Paraphoma chrysanthemicola TaxID=798071 RepID=A0A8K0QV62_9PLEO|nr:hypothetical protein FB567DRAFT_611130 [Paraphoma chrysanthemicola]
MYAQPLLIALISLLCLQVSSKLTGYGQTLSKALRERSVGGLDRELQAATKDAHLVKRHESFFTVTYLELSYIDGTFGDPQSLGAYVQCNSSVPLLLLEDFEHLTEIINCEPGSITISLPSNDNWEATDGTLRELERGGLVVTSHVGCNSHGERSLFRIGNITADQVHSSIVLDAVPATWEASFTSIAVKMYPIKEKHTLRSQPKLRVRQDDAVPTSTRSNNRPAYTISEPTATSTADVNTFNLTQGLINKPLIGSANSSVQVTCKNCSTFGTLDFSFTSFVWNIPKDLEGGEITVVANSMGARVELLINVTGNDTLNVPLFVVPLLYGIAVKGIGAVGLLYAPTVHVEFALNGSITFEYGFEINVPDKSRLFIDMTDPKNSTIQGFDETSITEIPFQASVDVNKAVIDVSLRHQIQAGFFFDSVSASIGMGVYLDLPRYRAEFEKVEGVDENCTTLAMSQSENKGLAQELLTNAYNITPSVNWQVGVAGEAKLFGVGPDIGFAFGNGTIDNLPSTCLMFNQTSKTYVDAKKVISDAKKNGASRSDVRKGAMVWLALVSICVILAT